MADPFIFHSFLPFSSIPLLVHSFLSQNLYNGHQPFLRHKFTFPFMPVEKQCSSFSRMKYEQVFPRRHSMFCPFSEHVFCDWSLTFIYVLDSLDIANSCFSQKRKRGRHHSLRWITRESSPFLLSHSLSVLSQESPSQKFLQSFSLMAIYVCSLKVFVWLDHCCLLCTKILVSWRLGRQDWRCFFFLSLSSLQWGEFFSKEENLWRRKTLPSCFCFTRKSISSRLGKKQRTGWKRERGKVEREKETGREFESLHHLSAFWTFVRSLLAFVIVMFDGLIQRDGFPYVPPQRSRGVVSRGMGEKDRKYRENKKYRDRQGKREAHLNVTRWKREKQE